MRLTFEDTVKSTVEGIVGSFFGEEVVLDPVAFIREAQLEAMKSIDEALENAVPAAAQEEFPSDE